MMTQRRGDRRRAFSLTEMAIVTGIMGLVLGAVWVGVSQVRTNSATIDTVKQVLSLANNVRVLYDGKSSFASGVDGRDIASSLISAGAVPREMLDSNDSTQMRNAWSGQVHILAFSNGIYRIQYENLPRTVCTDLATQLSGTRGDGSPQAVWGNNGSISYSVRNYGALNVNMAGYLCGTGTTPTDIGFEFSLKN